MGELNLLQKKIMKDGVIKAGNVLKVDSFLNHQIDVAFVEELGREFKARFVGEEVTKVLTVEASGILVAAMGGYILWQAVMLLRVQGQG